MANSKTILYNRQDKNFMWVFDHKDFSVIDILEIAEYDITMDEETNATSRIIVNKETRATANDIVVFKKNNTIIFWGVIQQINNSSGEKVYEYICRYFTNLFDQSVVLEQNITESVVPEGFYRFVSVANTNGNIAIKESSTDDNALAQIWSINGLKNGIWEVIPYYTNGNRHYKIKNVNSGKYLDVLNGAYTTMGKEFCQTANSAAIFDFIYDSEACCYGIAIAGQTYQNKRILASIDDSYSLGEGTKLQTWYQDDENNPGARQFYLQKTTEPIIWNTGIEDFLKLQIDTNFINNEDTFVNRDYLQIVAETHTPKEASVQNVENGIYNLHTFMANCTQNYNVIYEFKMDTTQNTPKIIITIKTKTMDTELIDVKGMAITDYDEVFDTDIVSKVIVITSTKVYKLFLKTNRETTEDQTDQDRADGRTEIIYVENYDEANQSALDIINSNQYNHNISFSLKDKYYPIGTPIKIKTKTGTVYDTYISSVAITDSSFYSYQCGNIRITLIEKLLKERK